jgi:hypothetical protein
LNKEDWNCLLIEEKRLKLQEVEGKLSPEKQ